MNVNLFLRRRYATPKTKSRFIVCIYIDARFVSLQHIAAAEPTSTSTPKATATITITPTNTPRPSTTPRPTKTPNLAATQHMEDFNAEAKSYFDLGYLTTADGKFFELTILRKRGPN